MKPDFEEIAKRLYVQLVLTTTVLETPGDLSDREKQLIIANAAETLDEVAKEVRAGWENARD